MDDWRQLYRALQACFVAERYADAAALVARIAAIAEELDHHPDVDLRYGSVLVSVISHDVGEVTDRDRRFAERVSAAAAELGLTSAPERTRNLELAIDAVDADAVRPFWAAILAYDVTADGSLADPGGQGPAIWFQPMDPPRTDRNRIHLDVFVAADRAEERLAAALAAGGRLRSDAEAPSFWVLADAEGNEACLCTSLPAAQPPGH